MTRSVRASTNLPADQSVVILGGLLLALACYALPWVTTRSFSTSLNAYDLAEWMSIHPTSYTGSPILLTAFLLRLPLTCVAALAGWLLPGRLWSVRWGSNLVFVLVITALLLPPLEILEDLSNPNYTQQLFLALSALILGIMGLIVRPQLAQRLIILMAVIVGLATIGATIQAVQMLSALGLEAAPTAGSILMVGILCIVGLYQLSMNKQ